MDTGEAPGPPTPALALPVQPGEVRFPDVPTRGRGRPAAPTEGSAEGGGGDFSNWLNIQGWNVDTLHGSVVGRWIHAAPRRGLGRPAAPIPVAWGSEVSY